ncbi:DUF2254 domain-containing protein [Phormidesmis priestleyi ULC007]|uniref:DUF2254 domain-containing protein n=1 Tax=Phormidesmis priestleyi ULC007 TaxID=1920490 RepID=A0A2T1DM47_9CYAN|nr:DUF2254 domain-containing protein [Phormidesmis priestleyi]PSB21546.1 DUF2254 domain-containing protein [Phormidesmis priestleyi ULC007]PZO54586.1 MAG: DUF2254 domain-containing protein [Phormidesmis priestleyi]
MKNTKLTKLWDSLQSSYWFLPTLIAGVAAVLALILLYVDWMGKSPGFWWLYTGGPDGARSMLSTVAGAMATVSGTAFSITIVALQLASSNFGPRLLRNFMHDVGNQIVLGTFIGTFLYCLLVLRTIRGEGFDKFVPQLSVTVGMGLAIFSTLVLIYFIHHASTIIQASSVISNVSDELERTINQLFPQQIGHSSRDTQHQIGEIPTQFEQRSAPIKATKKGYLQLIDDENLMKIARQADVLLCLKVRPGSYLIPGIPLALVYPQEHVSPKLTKQINDVFIVGKERTEKQDIAFPIEQLVEVASRALSPGINDPFTAIRCIDRLGAGLSLLVQRDFPSPYRYDNHHTLRVIVEPVTFEFLVDRAFTQIRQYGQSDSVVMMQLLDAIALVAAYAETPKQQMVLQHHAEMILRGSRQGLSEEYDRSEVEKHYQTVLGALNNRPPAPIKWDEQAHQASLQSEG